MANPKNRMQRCRYRRGKYIKGYNIDESNKRFDSNNLATPRNLFCLLIYLKLLFLLI